MGTVCQTLGKRIIGILKKEKTWSVHRKTLQSTSDSKPEQSSKYN